LYGDYEAVCKELARMETGIENAADDVVEQRKKTRLHLKDQLLAMLKKTAA
ncbi:MAG: YdcH family protein, partial [Alphaproteobacteria bacterium]